MRWWLFLCAVVHTRAADTTKPPDGKKNKTKDHKQPGWGSPHFHVHLKGLRTNEGAFEPKFDTLYSGTYTLKVDDPTVDEVVLTPILNLRKYQPRFTPKITLNDKEIAYEPINTIEVHVPLNDTYGGFDHNFELTIADPESGYISGNTMTYYINIIQDPSPHITDMSKLKVADAEGNEIYKVDSTHTNRFSFIAGPEIKSVFVDFACQPNDDEIVARINGHDAYTPYELKLESTLSDVCLTCAYTDDEFTPDGEISRTYLIEVERNATLGNVALALNVVPRIGHCHMDTDTHWMCTSKFKNFQLISSWNVSDATLEITDTRKGAHFHMMNNIPTIVELEKGTQNFDIKLAAGEHTRKYTMDVTLVTQGGLVLADLPVLLGLWWGQGECSKVGKKYVCWVKQGRINLVVHYSQSDLITAEWISYDPVWDANSTIPITMGMPSQAIDVAPGVEKNLTLHLYTDKDSVTYDVSINLPDDDNDDSEKKGRKRDSHPMSVEEENKKKRDEKRRKKKLREEAEKKDKVEKTTVLDDISIEKTESHGVKPANSEQTQNEEKEEVHYWFW